MDLNTICFFSLILTFIKPCVLSPKQASLLSSILLPSHPSPAKLSSYLFATLLHGKKTFLCLNLLSEYSFQHLNWVCLSLPRPVEVSGRFLPYPTNLRLQSQWHILPSTPVAIYYSSITASTFAMHPCR